MSRIDRIDGISLYVARRRGWWRPWWWCITDYPRPQVEGFAWTRRRAIQHGRIARAVRVLVRGSS